MGEQVLTIGANTTSVVGHSITTRGYLISMDRMAKSKKFLSSRQEESHGRELDAFSKRMLKHLEVPAPLSGQPFFATLRQSVESGDTSSNLFKRSSKTQKELHLAEGTSRAKRKRRGIESYLTDHLDVGLDDDRYRIHEGLDDHELDAVHRGSSGVQHALQGKRGQAESISNDSAKHLQGPAVANQGEDGTTRNDHTSLAMDISDDDIDMEIMGGLKGMIKEGTPADRRVGRDPVALEDNEADFFGAPSSPGFDDSIFEYDMAMDMDSDSGGAWQVERDGDGQGTDWDAVGGRKESECAGQDVEGFDFGASQRLVRGRRGWYTSDQSSESEDEAEERDYGKDETSMLMVLPPVPRAIVK
ncbi:hypothetical protein BGZ94_005688 [Podila epigama]|nr:hypothetical protein BGZ94_005688 [Podila epigama]